MKFVISALLLAAHALAAVHLLPSASIKVLDNPAAFRTTYYPDTHSHGYKKPKYPVLALLQGANVPRTAYTKFCKELARYGYIVVVPDTKVTIPFPGYLANANAITNVLAYAKTANADATSPLHGIVDTKRMGVTGHSFGGVAGMCGGAKDGLTKCLPLFFGGAYTKPKELKAGAFYGASLVRSNALIDLNTHGFPVALVQGAQDTVAKPADAATTYPSLEKPKALITVAGADHYGITDTATVAGTVPDLAVQTLTQDQSTKLIAKWVGLWMRQQLDHDEEARKTLKHAANVQSSY
jgi:predicted dienelactone hydrolase